MKRKSFLMPESNISMGKSIKTNFIFNIINTVSAFLFPLITFPYASRIIMAEGIGQVQFYTSIINYVLLLSSLGIPLYGIREIARVRDDKKELTKTTIELISLNLLLNVIGYVVITIMCITLSKIQVNIPLFLLLSTSIVLTTIGCPWFYTGVEDFKYVTIRGIIVKLVCIVFLFIFVKSQDDLLYYGVYTVMGSIGNYLINFASLRKYIDINLLSIREINIRKHVKPACAIFVFNIITSIYINLDSVMLGFLKDSTAVGYYTAGTKISHIMLTLVTSFSAVLLPRTSNLVKNEKYKEFYQLSQKAYQLILLLSLPICMGVIVLAPPLIHIFCGRNFELSINTLQIISPIIISLGLSNLIGIQILYPLGKIKLVIYSTCVGAVINVILNSCLIPIFAHNGAAIATVIAETGVTVAQIMMIKKIIPIRLFDMSILKCVLSAIAMMIVCLIINSFIQEDVMKIIVIPMTGIFMYSLCLLITKNSLFLEMSLMVLKKIKK